MWPLRPFSTPVLALFGDYALRNKQSWGDGTWSAGAVLEALPGIRLTGRYFNTKAFSIGLDLSLGRLGFASQTVQEEGGGHLYNTYGVRLGAYDRNVIDEYFRKGESYLDMDLIGRIGYQRYRWFDGTKTLSSLLEMIDAAEQDDAIAGIAINTSGMEANREMMWEIRDRLRAFRAAGKHVVIFVDRAGMELYHFASVADKIVMDPLGGLSLSGFVIGRTYLKGTLEKIGIGFDELRFFKYKSAAETFSARTCRPPTGSNGRLWLMRSIVRRKRRYAQRGTSPRRNLTPSSIRGRSISLPRLLLSGSWIRSEGGSR